VRGTRLLTPIFLVATLVVTVAIGAVLYLWMDEASEAEARLLSVGLDNGIRRIQSEVALEFSVISSLFIYLAEERDDGQVTTSTELMTGLYERWLLQTRFPDLIASVALVSRTGDDPEVTRTTRSGDRFITSTGEILDLSPLARGEAAEEESFSRLRVTLMAETERRSRLTSAPYSLS